jgi:hypothetical protein
MEMMMMMILSPPPCGRNRSRRLKNKQPTINPDSSAFGKDRMADETANEPTTSNDTIGTADKPEQRQAPPCKFMMTAKED